MDLHLGQRITIDRHTELDRYVTGVITKLWGRYVRIAFDNGGFGSYDVSDIVAA